MLKFYNFTLRHLGWFIDFWGKLHFPFTHKKITGKNYFLWRDEIDIGSIFLTETRGEFSNLINPTKPPHGAIYLGDVEKTGIRYVLESVGRGVVLTDLVTFLTSKDVVVVCKPKFIRNQKQFNIKVQEEGLKLLGIPYDKMFSMGNEALYCFETGATVLKAVYPELQLKCKEIVKGKRIYDPETFLDPDFFDVVIDSRELL